MKTLTSTTRRTASPGAALALGLVTASVLAGCASPGNTTCEEYAALSYDEQFDLERDLLRAHDLESYDVGNGVGVRQSILSHCGLSGSNIVTGQVETATQNMSSPIDDAVNWDSGSW